MSLTADRLREVLHYEPVTGVFTWRLNMSSRARAGDKAGAISVYGYRQIRIDGVIYRANRLAVLYVTGEWPALEVDHKNRVRSDNRWDNLRDVSTMVNRQNSNATRRSKTGFRGVTYHEQSGLFHAEIKANKVRHSLRYHATPEEASAAYEAARAQLHAGYIPAPYFPRVPKNDATTGQKDGVADGTRTYASTPPPIPR